MRSSRDIINESSDEDLQSLLRSARIGGPFSGLFDERAKYDDSIFYYKKIPYFVDAYSTLSVGMSVYKSGHACIVFNGNSVFGATTQIVLGEDFTEYDLAVELANLFPKLDHAKVVDVNRETKEFKARMKKWENYRREVGVDAEDVNESEEEESDRQELRNIVQAAGGITPDKTGFRMLKKAVGRGFGLYLSCYASLRHGVDIDVSFEQEEADEYGVTKVMIDHFHYSVERHISGFERKIQRAVEERRSELTDDSEIIQILDANENYYDEDGKNVPCYGVAEMREIARTNRRFGNSYARIMDQFRDFFLSEFELVKHLDRLGKRFDADGNILKVYTISELLGDPEVTDEDDADFGVNPEAGQKILDANRGILVEDSDWYTDICDEWMEDIEKCGYEGVEIECDGENVGIGFESLNVIVHCEYAEGRLRRGKSYP